MSGRRPEDASMLAGFWELPEAADVVAAEPLACVGEFRHTITNHRYRYSVYRAAVRRAPRSFHWMSAQELEILPLTTATKKALDAWSQDRHSLRQSVRKELPCKS